MDKKIVAIIMIMLAFTFGSLLILMNSSIMSKGKEDNRQIVEMNNASEKDFINNLKGKTLYGSNVKYMASNMKYYKGNRITYSVYYNGTDTVSEGDMELKADNSNIDKYIREDAKYKVENIYNNYNGSQIRIILKKVG